MGSQPSAADGSDDQFPSQVEYVVLLDDDGRPCGRARKDRVHTAATPLHQAFSCWVLDDDGRVLLTRRALTKRTWPGVWTNAFCGHPAPGERVEDAVLRRARQELGTSLTNLTSALPTFRYTATMDDGTMENEVCPVFTARLAGTLAPDPSEIAGSRWVDVGELARLRDTGAGLLSPWLRMQLPLLLDGGLIAPATAGWHHG